MDVLKYVRTFSRWTCKRFRTEFVGGGGLKRTKLGDSLHRVASDISCDYDGLFTNLNIADLNWKI